MKGIIRGFLRDWAVKASFKPYLNKFVYPYGFSPQQMVEIARCYEEALAVEGAVVEVGVAWAAMSVFLNKYLDTSGVEKRYLSVDTFGGFVADDVQYEYQRRGKRSGLYSGLFADNSENLYRSILKVNGVERVEVFKSDANLFNFSDHAPYSFAFLDVDLYRPIARCLDALYPLVASGGIIVVDDCDEADALWDGAAVAYREFCERKGLPVDVRCGKLGIIKVP